MLGFMVSQRVRLDWVTELNWTDYSMVYIHHNFFIHSSADGRLSFFHVLDIVNSAAVTIGVHVSLWGYMCLFRFWFPWCVCPAVGLLGHKAVLFPLLKGISTLFSIVAVLVCIPTNSVRGFPFSTPSPAFIACRLLDSSHSDWREMVPHCGFDLHFSDNE